MATSGWSSQAIQMHRRAELQQMRYTVNHSRSATSHGAPDDKVFVKPGWQPERNDHGRNNTGRIWKF